MGRENASTIDASLADAAREVILAAISAHAPVTYKLETTPLATVDVELLEIWRRAAGDPDDQPTKWLIEGAPAGLTSEIVDRGIFPLYDPEADAAEFAADSLCTEPDFANYPGVEESTHVADELARLVKLGFVMEFDGYDLAQKFVGGDIVLSRIAVIEKLRNGKMKVRIVVDSKRSCISRASRRFERCLLPRVTDCIDDMLALLDAAEPDELVELMVADFSDAFFILPLRPAERRFFVVQFRGSYYVFLRSTQGSRSAPLTWARLAALVARLTQGTLGSRSRLSVYVDDPLGAYLGTVGVRQRSMAMTLLMWGALKLPLSLSKASRGSTLTWTSAVFRVITDPTNTRDLGILVRVKPTLVEEVQQQTLTFLTHNVVSIKKLRSYTGKLMHMASLVHTIRPFLTDLYGAIHSKDLAASGAPSGCVWTRQIHHVLLWMAAFLSERPGSLHKLYPLSAYRRSATRIGMHLDASPWGLGGYLSVDGDIVAWFASALSDAELSALQLQRGSSSAQQAVEALCALVALRAWQDRWRDRRWSLRVRSDSVSALVLALKLKTSGAAAGIVAREMALDMAAAPFPPIVAEHIPGIANVVPDILSRRHDPKYAASWEIPPLLAGVAETQLPARDAAYFRSLRPPPLAAAASDTPTP
jgi:hypothetical protein